MIQVLRLGHRPGRDDRLSTHVGLVARALGADGIVYSGQRDEGMMEGLRDVAERFGGSFEISYEEEWRRFVKNFDGTVVHLTMRGRELEDAERLEEAEDMLVVVGGEKVPGEIYDLADYNVAVTDQPHSEVGSLAVLLWEVAERKDFPEPGFEKRF